MMRPSKRLEAQACRTRATPLNDLTSDRPQRRPARSSAAQCWPTSAGGRVCARHPTPALRTAPLRFCLQNAGKTRICALRISIASLADRCRARRRGAVGRRGEPGTTHAGRLVLDRPHRGQTRRRGGSGRAARAAGRSGGDHGRRRGSAPRSPAAGNGRHTARRARSPPRSARGWRAARVADWRNDAVDPTRRLAGS